MAKQSVTISIESEVWKKFQKHCLDIRKKPSQVIERFMRKNLHLVIRNGRLRQTISAKEEAFLLRRKLLEKGRAEGEINENGSN